jgi:hypothetical protein
MDPANLPESFFQALKLNNTIDEEIRERLKSESSMINALRQAQSHVLVVDQVSHERLRWVSEIVRICDPELDAYIFLLSDDSLENLSGAALK